MRPSRTVAGFPASHRYRVARLDTDAFLPAIAVKDTWTVAFEFPVGHVSLVVLDINVEIAVSIGPLDFRHLAGEREGLVAVVFGAEGMVRRERNRNQKHRGK